MNKESFKRQIRILRRKKWPTAVAMLLIIAIIAIPVTGKIKSNYKRFSAKNPITLSSVFIKGTDREKIHLIAHRGYSSQAPENTVPAIEKAAEYGFDCVEIDVQQTQDGVWVLSHDSDVKAMTDKSGKISSFTYYDLVTCTIDNGANHKKYENLKIPTLDHALNTCLENNITPMIEIKGYTEEGIKPLLDIIDRNGFTKSCSVISFDRNALELVRKANPDIKLYALVSKLDNDAMAKCLENKDIGVSFSGNQKMNDKEKIKQLQDAEIPLACWTIDDGETMKKYYKMGITDFVSNRICPQ